MSKAHSNALMLQWGWVMLMAIGSAIGDNTVDTISATVSTTTITTLAAIKPKEKALGLNKHTKVMAEQIYLWCCLPFFTNPKTRLLAWWESFSFRLVL